MSNTKIERMRTILLEVKQREKEMARLLIDNPYLGDIPEKDEIYQMAIHYFKSRRERRRSDERAFYNGAMSLNLLALVESYKEAQEDNKSEYARKIAQCILEFQGYYLGMIPEEIKEEAFQIIIEYLEVQRRS